MNILNNWRFFGGGIVMYMLAGAAYALQNLTDMSGLLSFGIVVGMFALVPVILLVTKKAYIADKRLATKGVFMIIFVMIFGLALLLLQSMTCGSTMLTC